MDNITDLMNEFDKNGLIRVLEKNQLERKKSALLSQLIEQVSKKNGGDDPVFLSEYIDNVISEWSHDTDKALACFRDYLFDPYNQGEKI